ncbi:hypothetical protein D3C73_492020 [compost metagenome]
MDTSSVASPLSSSDTSALIDTDCPVHAPLTYEVSSSCVIVTVIVGAVLSNRNRCERLSVARPVISSARMCKYQSPFASALLKVMPLTKGCQLASSPGVSSLVDQKLQAALPPYSTYTSVVTVCDQSSLPSGTNPISAGCMLMNV